MRILYIHQYFVFADSPGGTRSYDLATSFVQRGHEVVVVTSSSFIHGDFKKRWTVLHRDGLELHVLRSNYSNQLSLIKRLLVFTGFMLSSIRRCLKVKADVVLATSSPLTVAVPAIVKKIFHRTPFIFEVRDVWPEAPIAMGVIKNRLVVALLKWFERYTYKLADHVVALSDGMKNSILCRTDIDRSKLSVIPNISNIQRFSHVDPGVSLLKQHIGFVPKKSLLYAGTFGDVNGLNALIDLAAETSRIDPELKFILIGWGKQKDNLISSAKEKGLADSIIYFLKPVAKNIIPQLYNECTVTSSFVIPVPELWVNSANKFFDSLAASRPVVINYGGWQSKVIEEKNIGFVINTMNGNLKEVANEFCQYINNEELLHVQRANALQLAEERYSLEIAIRSYLHILDKVNKSGNG